jgi:hypothetical protein
MNELALDISSAPELLCARDVATLLKVSHQVVRKRMAKVAPTMRDGIQTWPVDLFPPDYQFQLQSVRKRSGLWTYADILVHANRSSSWTPKKKLSELPEYSQGKAYKVREVMLAYFAALDEGKLVLEANCAARSKWLEVFAEGTTYKTIDRWAKKIESRGTVEYLPIEAYADEKSCDHEKAKLAYREKIRGVGFGELIRELKWRSVQPDMTVTAAARSLEDDWNDGKPVPGIAPKTSPGQRFPYTIAQLRNFAPSGAARKRGNKGTAAALRDALPNMDRTHANLRPCELYVMDDTRINIVTLSDDNGKRVELKCYIAMEVASRRIVGYVLREGHMLASDVDALLARVFRTCGLAHPNAGYPTTVLFERGSVACSPQRQQFLEATFPGRLVITRTSMDGGKNFAGDYAQAGSGHWMGKGVIESFMRTLGYITRRIPGQRGSTYQDQPAMVGHPGEQGAHKGGMVHEAELVAQAARAAAYLKSNGVDTNPSAADASEELGVKLPLLYTRQFRKAFARAIESYNSAVGHRREGFRQIERIKDNGGITTDTESSNQRWTWLLRQAEQHGKAPMVIPPADAVMLLHKARPVTVTKNGVYLKVDKVSYRYWDADSLACAEAGRLTNVEKRFIAIVDEENLDEIHILQNPVGPWKNGDTPRFLEALPLYEKPDVMDKVALAKSRNALQVAHNRSAEELADIAEPYIEERTEDRNRNRSKFVGVVTTTGSVSVASSISAATNVMKRQSAQLREKREEGNAPSPSRREAAPDDLAAFAASLTPEKP